MKTTSTEKQLSTEELISKYRRYIIKVASTLTNDDYIKEELIQEAYISIWKAYQRFDSTEGTLHSYIISYIRGSMLNYLTDSIRTVKPSARLIHHINRTEGEELIKTISIDKEIEDGYNLSETISMEEEDTSMDDQQQLIRGLLKQYVSQLKERYQLILNLRYNEEKTIEEIGDMLGISRQAVDDQLGKALSQLQKAFGVEEKRIKGVRMQKEKKLDKK